MTRHIPVLLDEIIKYLNLSPNYNVVDCTLGDGGHSKRILEETAPDGKLLGIDCDSESLKRSKDYLSDSNKRIVFVNDNFRNLKSIIDNNFNYKINGILMDLGWSTPQFEERGRGFSFNSPIGKDEPLDMRFGDLKSGLTAGEIINTYSERELSEIFRQYGEEKLYKEIARQIIDERKINKINSSKDLTEIILSVYRKKLKSSLEVPRIGKIHPATKTFQALRIAVNDELETLKQALPQALGALCPKGRLAVITFHSLEDRIVKHYFQSITDQALMITKKPIVASISEIKNNPKARSAKLRVIEKI